MNQNKLKIYCDIVKKLYRNNRTVDQYEKLIRRYTYSMNTDKLDELTFVPRELEDKIAAKILEINTERNCCYSLNNKYLVVIENYKIVNIDYLEFFNNKSKLKEIKIKL